MKALETESGLKLGAWLRSRRCLWKAGKTTNADKKRYEMLAHIGLFAEDGTDVDVKLTKVI